nr:MAG TPA: hypothetical protein [Caudoviricetes sp.]
MKEKSSRGTGSIFCNPRFDERSEKNMCYDGSVTWITDP